MKGYSILLTLIAVMCSSGMGQDYEDYYGGDYYGNYGNYYYGNGSDYYGNYNYGNGSYYYGNYNYGNYSDYYGNYNYGNGSDYYGNYYYGNGSYYYGNGSYGDYYDYSQEPGPETAAFTDCGGELTELPNGLLTTPNYPTEKNPGEVYPNKAYCKWWFNGDDKTLIRFKIWDLVIEIGEGNSNTTCDFDYINLTISSIGSQRFCGYSVPEDEIRGLGSLTIIFVSDADTNYRGMQAAYQILEDHDPCNPTPCSPQGECEVLEDLMRIRCICEDGYRGQRCEIDIPECESNPCQNGGTCNDKAKIDHYECTCVLGYEGTNCEIKIKDPCIVNPCQHDGKCRKHTETTYSCECAENYTGTSCEIENFPPCFSSPCKNNGSCLDFVGEVKYLTLTGIEGEDGDIEVEAPPEYFGFNCTCTKKHRGTYCEIDAGCANPGIPDLEDGYWFDPEATVEYSCVDGYILNGLANSTCYADGTWSQPMPECVVNETAAAMKQKGPVTPWSGTMMALGGAFLINMVAFTSWMIVKGPWKKVDRIINISQASLKSRDEVEESSCYDDDDDDASDDATSSGSGSQSYSSSGSSIRDIP